MKNKILFFLSFPLGGNQIIYAQDSGQAGMTEGNMYASIFAILLLALGIRTALWHLQSWQIREYRWDRLRDYFRTQDGKKNIWNLWFFRGILPRPRLSGRIALVGFLFVLWSLLFFCSFKDTFPLWLNALLWERTIWIGIMASVGLSKIPVLLVEKWLYIQAKKIIDQSQNIIRIGITGSYGKSSTKEILVHILTEHFGKENVLFNPENQNHEIALARLIRKNESFFQSGYGSKKAKKFFVAEIGAYRRGEIRKVCRFIQPHIGILTGINAQHLSLFGSQENIQKGKFELAEETQDKVFFNADSSLLSEIFADREIKATPIPLSLSAAKNISVKLTKTEFELYGKKTFLPWAGKFFVGNALLAAEVARELGMEKEKILKSLQTLPPLQRALHTKEMPSGATILFDLYSANPDGVLQAIEHLGREEGRKIFIGLPLLELGKDAARIHEQIFEALREINAEVFWLKDDFAEKGRQICGEKFHGTEYKKLASIIPSLGKNDAVLLESRLPQNIVKLFS